jgi:hypothetical protein
MNKNNIEYQKFRDFYNVKSISHSLFILFFHILTAIFALSGDYFSYSVAFFINLTVIVAYLVADTDGISFVGLEEKNSNSNRYLAKAFASMCFFTWAVVLESFIFGFYTSKIFCLYGIIAGWGFVGVFSQLPFYIQYKTKSLLVYFALIWIFRLGLLFYVLIAISAIIFGEWILNVMTPFELI